jgi:hypothetical protein
MNPEVAVFSDAAVSTLVSSSTGDYRITSIDKVKNETCFNRLHPIDFSIQKFCNLSFLSKKLFSDTGLSRDKFSKVFVNNYAQLSAIFVESCGFEVEKSYYNNISKLSHCLAGDVLINLKDQEDFLSEGDHIFTMADSHFCSFGMCLDKVH